MTLTQLILKVPRWLMSAVCFLLIIYLTLVPQPLPDNDLRFWEHSDKLVHAIMFGGLYFCLVIDSWRLRRYPPLWPSMALVGAVALLGGVIEVLQQAMQLGRGGSAADFVADVCGILCTWALMKRLPRKLPVVQN